MREANARKNMFKLPGEIVTIETVKTQQGEVKVPVSVEKPTNTVATPKKITQKYHRLKREKAAKKISDRYEKVKKNENIDIKEEINDAATKKRARIAAKKVSDKYKRTRARKRPHTFHVNEADLETIQYDEPSQEDIFASESVLAAANKVFDFNKYKKEQAKALDEMKRQQIDDELFANESVLAAVNKLFDFDNFQKQQADAIREFKKQQRADAEAINYVDDLDLNNLKENKSTKIAAKKISEKYRKMRKRKRPNSPIIKTFESFKKPSKKGKSLTDSAALIAARSI